jgi:hypothetical protein
MIEEDRTAANRCPNNSDTGWRRRARPEVYSQIYDKEPFCQIVPLHGRAVITQRLLDVNQADCQSHRPAPPGVSPTYYELKI